MKKLRPKPFRGCDTLNDVAVLDVVSIKSDGGISDSLRPGRQAAFVIIFTSKLLANKVKEINHLIEENKLTVAQAIETYSYLWYSAYYTDMGFISLLLSDGIDGWWPLTMDSNHRCFHSMANPIEYNLPTLNVIHQGIDRADGFTQNIPYFKITQPAYTCGKGDKRKIREAIRVYLKGLEK